MHITEIIEVGHIGLAIVRFHQGPNDWTYSIVRVNLTTGDIMMDHNDIDGETAKELLVATARRIALHTSSPMHWHVEAFNAVELQNTLTFKVIDTDPTAICY